MRILFADEDDALAQAIAKAIEDAGMIAERAVLGDGAEDEVALYDCDAMVIGDALGPVSLPVFLTTVRRNKVDLPIVALTENGAPSRVAALDAGADDVLEMPFSADELVARLRAVTRRRFGFASNVVDVGPLRVDLRERRAAIDGVDVGLTPNEFAVLEALVRRRGWVVGKPTIIAQTYRDVDARDPKVVDVFVCRIRDKFAALRPELEFIVTRWGQGFCVPIGEPSPRLAGPGVIAPAALLIEGEGIDHV